MNSSEISNQYKVVGVNDYFFVYDYYHDVMKYPIKDNGVVTTIKKIPGSELAEPKGDMQYRCDNNIKPDQIEYIEPAIKLTQSRE